MNWRLFWIAAFVCCLGVANVAFLLNEEVAPPDALTKAESRQLDPLLDVRFLKQKRAENLVKMGFDEKESVEIQKRIEQLSADLRVGDAERDIVRARIEAASDPDALGAALCGTGTTLHVRYGALAFLVDDQKGERRAIALDQVSALEPQAWAAEARIAPVYQEVELAKDRKSDATRMGLAAILAEQEEAVLAKESPWGRSLLSNWSWPRVQAKFPGVRGRLIEYVATLHLVIEVANGEAELCSTGEDGGAL